VRTAVIELVIAAVFLGAVVATGVSLVATKHESRRLYQEREGLRREEDRLQDDWSALELEVATLAAHARIDTVARGELGLIEPGAGRVYVEVGP
jgi:cell division protein FtsL